MSKDSEIKFRCEEDLRARFERVALLERRSPADLARIIFEDYIADKERTLGLVLRESASPGPARDAKPASYRKRK